MTGLYGSGEVQYVRNIPSLGQSENVHKLLELARGELLVLLHDDDLLLPDAIASMVNCFVESPGLTAAYGKQFMIRQDGTCDETLSRLLNADFRRTSDHVGLQRSAMYASLTGQFPNDGFMIRAIVAKAIGYRSDAKKVGVACDLDFGLRLAAAADGFYFLDQYTAMYRIHGESVTAGNKDANLIFDILASVELSEDLELERMMQMRKFSRSAVIGWLAAGDRNAAFRVYMSPAHGWRQRTSAMGLMHAVLLVFPAYLAQWLIRYIRKLRRAPRVLSSGLTQGHASS